MFLPLPGWCIEPEDCVNKQHNSLPLRGLYSPESAAEYLSISRATLYRWIASGRLVGFRTGRLRRFKRSELDALADALESEAS